MPLPSLPLPGIEPRELTRADIKRIVQERLSGFLVRQMVRDAIRFKKRRKPAGEDRQEHFPEAVEFQRVEEKASTRPRAKGEPIVKCPIVFRAAFKGAKGPMKSGIDFPGMYEIEAYNTRINPPPGEWKARYPATKVDYKGITPQTNFGTLKRQIEDICFHECDRNWDAFDSRQRPIRKLKSDEWQFDKDGKPYLTEHYLDVLKAEEANRRDAGIAERKAKALEGM